MFSLSTSLVPSRPTTTTVSLRKNTNTKVRFVSCALLPFFRFFFLFYLCVSLVVDLRGSIISRQNLVVVIKTSNFVMTYICLYA